MTRKDFELIAATLLGVRADVLNDLSHKLFTEAEGRGALEAVERVARDFASHLGRTNPRFDRQRFLKACGVAS